MAIAENPRKGIGHPEPLVGGEDIIYSRRITAHDRIIYSIHDQEVIVIIIELEGHYKDK
jgi:toxin YoeB